MIEREKNPNWFQIEVTNRCNLSCPMCPRNTADVEKRDMSVEIYEKVLGKLPNRGLVSLLGLGEPLLHPQLFEMIRMAKDRGNDVSITTNAFLLDEEKRQHIIDSKLDYLRISLDQTSEMQEGYGHRWNESTVANIKEMVRMAKEAGRPHMMFNVVVNKSNAEAVFDIIQYAKELGIDAVNLIKLARSTDTVKRLSLKEEEKYFERYHLYAEKAGIELHSTFWKRHQTEKTCPFYCNFFYINLHGDVTPCCHLPERKYAVGNLLTADLDSIWNGALMKKFWNEYPESCGSCYLLLWNKHTCRTGGAFTVHNDHEVDAVVEKHLSHIVERLKLIPSVRSIILGGGFGRGEGSVLIDQAGIRPINDYDIFVVVSDDDKTDCTAMSNIIAKEIGMRMIDIIPVTYSALPTLPATQFYYDLKYGSRHLWGEYILDLIPEYEEGHVDPEAGRTLLMNRLICAIEAYSEKFEQGQLTRDEGFFLLNQTGKVISACVEALLIKKGRYHHSYRKRQEIFEAEFPGKKSLIQLNKKATDFKLRPVMTPGIDPVTYWAESIHEYVKVIAEYILSDPRSPVEELMTLIRGNNAELTDNQIEHIELMLLLYREASIPDKEIILSEARRKIEIQSGATLPAASWEDIRETTARLWHEIHQGKKTKNDVSRKDVVLLILIDGFRHDYINPVDSPFLHALAEQNIHGIVRETFAFELRPAFFAGLQPEECDVANMFCYNPEDSIFKSVDVRHGDRNKILLDLRNEAAKRGYSLVKHVGSPAEIPLPLLKYFNFSEKYHTADPSSIDGHKTLFDHLRKEGKKWLWIGYPDGPGTTTEVLNEFLERAKPDHDFIYLHFSELDWAGHEGGPHSYKQKRILREIDTAVRQVYSKLNQTFKGVRSVVFGDHGQVAIKKHIDIETMLKQTGLKLEEDYIYFLDSTQARFWFFNDAARSRVTELLGEIKDGTILTNDDYERLHFRFEDNKFGELIFVVNDGVGIFPNFFQSSSPCKGLHGYPPEVEGNWAKLIITGLGIEKKIEHPVEMVSIFPTLLELMECEAPSDISVKSVLETAGVPKPHFQYKASVVMPTYNRLEILKKCIHAIEKQTCAPEGFELIVVDDGSTDGTSEFLEGYKRNSKLNFRYFRQVNSGPAAARNVGIRNSSGEVIILIGDDMIMSHDFIENHLRFHEEWPQMGHACLGFINWPEDIEVNAFMKFITSPEGGQQFNYGYIESQNPDNLKWDCFWSSNLSFKKLFSLTNGLFNQQVFKMAMWEDIELGYRLGRAGLSLHYRKECKVYHEHKINFEGFIERQRMVGWHYPELKKTGLPAEYMIAGNENRIYSRKALSAIVKLLSGSEADMGCNDTETFNRLHNYALKYATLVGSKERENRLRENVDGDMALLMNLALSEQELAEKDSQLQERDARISELDNKCGSYEMENQRLSGTIGKIQGTVPVLERLLKKIYSEASSPEILVEAGEICFGFGSYDDAKGFFEKALLLKPGNAEALNNLGVVELHKGNTDNARSYFFKALSVDPDYEDARNNLNLLSEAVNAVT